MPTFLVQTLALSETKVTLPSPWLCGMSEGGMQLRNDSSWAGTVLNITCLKETKVAASDDIELASGHKLVLIQQRTAKYRGLGFVIAPRLKPFVRRWWYVSDHIAVLDLAIPCQDGTFCQCRVVNAYGPTFSESERIHQ